MNTACQRWNPGGVPSWRRPCDGGFDPGRYGVAPVSDGQAKEFVTSLHYSRSYPAAVHRYGLFDLAGPAPALAGVAVLSVPASKTVLTSVFPHLEPYGESLELGRFVLVDAVPANGESWFLGQCARLAATAGLRGLVMFSDPVQRRSADGTVVMPGHVGVIYQATNAVYTGHGTPRTLTVLPDGTVFSDRAAQKIRRRERGHDYAERQLVSLGARPPRAGEDPARWLAAALADVHARKIRHPGCHRYAFPLGTRRQRAAVAIAPRPASYPKKYLGQLSLFEDCPGPVAAADQAGAGAR
ncbi:MAG: hypothetical protein ACRDP7_39250 [Trebonia sp.]